jgi:outer membrane lipopolysaccharide assembly protein LptE/RlpB
MKKFVFISLVVLFLQSCGYSPMYGKNQNVNFYIEKVTFNDEDKDLITFIKSNLNRYSINYNENKFNIDAKINYKKNPVSKNTAGDIEEFELYLEIEFTITSKGLQKNLKIFEKFKMKNYTDEFEEIRYERTIKQNMARLVTAKLINQLTRFNAN